MKKAQKKRAPVRGGVMTTPGSSGWTKALKTTAGVGLTAAASVVPGGKFLPSPDDFIKGMDITREAFKSRDAKKIALLPVRAAYYGLKKLAGPLGGFMPEIDAPPSRVIRSSGQVLRDKQAAAARRRTLINAGPGLSSFTNAGRELSSFGSFGAGKPIGSTRARKMMNAAVWTKT